MITHEMGHVLGIGTVWKVKDLLGARARQTRRLPVLAPWRSTRRCVQRATASRFRWRTPEARDAGGPLAGVGLQNELMSGFIAATGNPLSRMTVGQSRRHRIPGRPRRRRALPAAGPGRGGRRRRAPGARRLRRRRHGLPVIPQITARRQRLRKTRAASRSDRTLTRSSNGEPHRALYSGNLRNSDQTSMVRPAAQFGASGPAREIER